MKLFIESNNESSDLTVGQKEAWLQKASNEELLRQFLSFHNTNKYGKNDNDIELVTSEILRRMN